MNIDLREGLVEVPGGLPTFAGGGLDSYGYLAFKITQRLEFGWRPLNGGLTLMTLLLSGARFVDGIYIPNDLTSTEDLSAA